MLRLALFHVPYFKVHFSVAGGKGFQSKNKKKTGKVQSLERKEQFDI